MTSNYVNPNTLKTTLPAYTNALDQYSVARVPIYVFNQDDNIGKSKEVFSFAWKPVIYSISPLTGPSQGGTSIRIRGKYYMNTPTLKCFIGDSEGQVTYISSYEIICKSTPVSTSVTEGVIALNFDGLTNITYLSQQGQPAKLFYYFDTIRVNKITPRFSLISAHDIDIVVEAVNIIPTHDNLKCRIGVYEASAKDYSYDSVTKISKITCNIPTYRSTVSSWNYDTDIVVNIDVSNNGIDFSNSNVQFMFVNQLTLVTNISPYRGPMKGGKSVSIGLRIAIPIEDYSPVCRFGDAVVPATISNPTMLTCATIGVYNKITDQYMKCYKDLFCAVNSSFELQGNSYRFSYTFYSDPSVEVLLSSCSGGYNNPIIIRGTGLFPFYEHPLARFSIDTNTKDIICKPLDYNNTIQCVPPIEMIDGKPLPAYANVEVSVNNGGDWSTNGKTYVFSDKDSPSSLDALSGPNTGNTKLTIKYTNIFQHEENNYDGYRCKFTTSGNPTGLIVPGFLNMELEEIYCVTPPKNKIDIISEDGNADVYISSNGMTFSTSKLTFTYYKEATFSQIDSPYLLIDLAYQKRITGNFPSQTPVIIPKVKLEVLGTSRTQVLNVVSYSTSEIVFSTIPSVFQFSDVIQVSISFNNGYNYQTAPFILKGIESSQFYSVLPSIVHISTAESIVNVIGKNFFSIPLYCVIDSTTTVPATRINSEIVLCHLPGKTVEATSRISIKIEEYPYTYSTIEVTHKSLPIINSISPVTIYAGAPNKITITGSGLSGNQIYVKLNEFVTICQINSDTECTFNAPGFSSGTANLMISLNGNFFDTITGKSITIQSCGGGQVCPTSFNNYVAPAKCPKGFYCQDDGYKVACAAGFYQDQESSTQCQPCGVGKYCPILSSETPITCPDGYLCTTAQIAYKDEMLVCPEGYYCPTGSTSFDTVLAGASSTAIQKCPAGYWCGYATTSAKNIYGNFMTSQKCNDGVSCPEISIDQTGISCQEGYYCTEGNQKPCEKGNYCPDPNMPQEVSCPPGQFNPDETKTFCKPCPLGTLCSSEGTINPNKCTPGFVCSLSGQVLPTTLCPGGKYCEGGTVTSIITSSLPTAYKPKLCRAGTYCLRGTRTGDVIAGDAGAAQICMEGIYCDEGSDGPEGQGYCQEGYYCPLNSKPIPAKAGYFANGKGNVREEPCPPGTFTNKTAAATCDVCPAGYYCPNEAMVKPIICPPGTYKEEDRNTIYCKLCPEGTWSSYEGLVSVIQCTICIEGVVCDKEGITNVTTQARSCPEGYICGNGTTSATENDVMCPEGYWCGKGTGTLRQLHVCEKGYYCGKGTSETARYYNRCPAGYYCPKGTAANITQEGVVLDLWVITGTEIYAKVIKAKQDYVDLILKETGEVIEDPDLLPLTTCSEDYGLPVILKQSYTKLQCPPGTTSDRESWCLGQCKKDATLIDQQSVINPIKSAPANNTRLLDEQFAETDLVWNKTKDEPAEYTLQALEYAKITFNFTLLPDILKYNDVYIIELLDSSNHPLQMPNYFDTANNNVTNKKAILQIRVTNASPNNKTVKVAIKILNGLYLPYINHFRNTVGVEISSPMRAEYGSNKLFGIFLYKETDETYTLPYNLRDFSIDMYSDMTSESEDVSLVKDTFERDPFDSTLWDSKSITTIALPWIPFFSGCKGQDRHILLYDLLENAEKCDLVNNDDTVVISPLLTTGLYGKADKCRINLECHYEENFNLTVANSIRWYQISSPSDLFYISSAPLTAEELFAVSPDNEYESNLAGRFTSQSREMIPVTFTPTQSSSEGVPTVIELEIFYRQVTRNLKKIVKAEGKLKEYSKDLLNEERPVYKLYIKYTPMNYLDLIDTYQFDHVVYILLFFTLSISLIFLGIMFWIINMCVRQASSYLTWVRLKHILEVAFLPPIIGGVLSTIPIILGIYSIYLIISPHGFLYSTPSDWGSLTIDTDEETRVQNKHGRIGFALIILGLVFIKYGSSLLVPSPNENEDDKVKDTILSRAMKEKELEEENEESESGIKSKETKKTIRTEPGGIEVEIKKRKENDFEQRTEELIAARDYMIYKRAYFFMICITTVLFMIIEFEFSYTTIFRNNVSIFLTVFAFHDIFLERLLINVVLKEALLVTPIMGGFVLSHMIMLLAEVNFQMYFYSYVIQTTALVIVQIYLNPVLERAESWILKTIVQLASKSEFFQKAFRNVLIKKLLEQIKLQSSTSQLSIGEKDVNEGMESVLRNVTLFTTQTQALIMFPTALFIIQQFNEECKLSESYQFDKDYLSYFIAFSGVMFLPQLLVNIFLLHSLEIVQGIKLIDYFTFAAYRYKTRATSWINEHWPLDRSIPHAWRSLDQMCFSSQFYFTVTTAAWGIILTMLGLTIVTHNPYQVFTDPFAGIFLIILCIIYFVSGYLLHEFCKMIQLWEVSRQNEERHSAKLGICPIDHFNNEKILIEEMNQDVFKAKFLGLNKEWLVHNLGKIIDKDEPRAIDVYQEIVNEGAKQEGLKNAGTKALRSKAMLPYNKDRGDDALLKSQIDVSYIKSSDITEPNKNKYVFDEIKIAGHNEPPRRILDKWIEKTRLAMKHKKLIDTLEPPKDTRCRICYQKERLQVDCLRPFYQIYEMYQRETTGMEFDAEYWKQYYLRHQIFRTICVDCVLVNHLMKSKLVQYLHKIESKRKEFISRVVQPSTLKILNLWKLTAKNKLSD